MRWRSEDFAQLYEQWTNSIRPDVQKSWALWRTELLLKTSEKKKIMERSAFTNVTCWAQCERRSEEKWKMLLTFLYKLTEAYESRFWLLLEIVFSNVTSVQREVEIDLEDLWMFLISFYLPCRRERIHRNVFFLRNWVIGTYEYLANYFQITSLSIYI